MKRTHRARRRRGGFTIVEILLVVVIIAALASLIAPRVLWRVGATKHKLAGTKLKQIEQAISLFRHDYERYPESVQELVMRPADIPEEKWNPPTLKAKDLLDPWQREYLYKFPGDHDAYDLWSLGADGEDGGERENADVNNWD